MKNEKQVFEAIKTAHRENNIHALRVIWNMLVCGSGRNLEAAKAAARDEMDRDAPALYNARQATFRAFDRARDTLIKMVPTGVYEWTTSHFGEYRKEQIYTSDSSAMETLCGDILKRLEDR